MECTTSFENVYDFLLCNSLQWSTDENLEPTVDCLKGPIAKKRILDRERLAMFTLASIQTAVNVVPLNNGIELSHLDYTGLSMDYFLVAFWK